MLTKSGKKIIPSRPPNQSNYLGSGAPTFVKPSKKPFGRRGAAAEPSMDDLADRTHPTRRA